MAATGLADHKQDSFVVDTFDSHYLKEYTVASHKWAGKQVAGSIKLTL